MLKTESNGGIEANEGYAATNVRSGVGPRSPFPPVPPLLRFSDPFPPCQTRWAPFPSSRAGCDEARQSNMAPTIAARGLRGIPAAWASGLPDHTSFGTAARRQP
jgi:hypothetical protein